MMRFIKIGNDRHIPLCCLAVHNGQAARKELFQMKIFVRQFFIAALQFTNFQNIIDQGEKVLRRCFDLLSAVRLSFLVFSVFLGDV